MSNSQAIPKKVLFVCLGNICRSPAAEGVLKRLLEQQDQDQEIFVDSAGTSSYHIGEPADKRMRTAAKNRGIQLTSRSRMVTQRDLVAFDLVIAMDKANLRELHGLVDGAGRGNLRLLSEYVAGEWPEEVPDPYFGGDEGFDFVLDMLEAACPAILAEATTQDVAPK